MSIIGASLAIRHLYCLALVAPGIFFLPLFLLADIVLDLEGIFLPGFLQS